MLAFYLSLAREIPTVLRGTVEAWAFWIWTVGAPMIALFNPELAKVIETPVFSRAFVGVPIGLSVLYGMMRVNYERFKALEGKNALLESANDTSDLPRFVVAGARGSWMYSNPMAAVTTSSAEPIDRIKRYYVLLIDVENSPQRRTPRSSATNVTASIQFFTNDKPPQPAVAIIGQWITKSAAPRHIGADETGPIVDIPANNLPARLYIALRPKRSQNAYAYAKENLHANIDGSHPPFELRESEYKVLVRLSCSESEQDLWLRLKTKGPDEEPLVATSIGTPD